MKKLIVVGIAALSLTLTACGGQSFNSDENNGKGQPGAVGERGQDERDPNSRSIYNDNLYCNGHTYVPLPGDEYQCEDYDHSGIVILPHTSRSKYTTAPKLAVPSTKPKAPVQAPKPAAPAPKPAAPKPAAPAYKAPAPAPYKAPAPAPKTGK